MTPHDELTSAEDDYCLAEPGNVYAVYLPSGGAPDLDLGESSATFEIRWFNPRAGGSLQIGTIASVTGPGKVAIGQPLEDTDKDWVALVERVKPRRLLSGANPPVAPGDNPAVAHCPMVAPAGIRKMPIAKLAAVLYNTRSSKSRVTTIPIQVLPFGDDIHGTDC